MTNIFWRHFVKKTNCRQKIFRRHFVFLTTNWKRLPSHHLYDISLRKEEWSISFESQTLIMSSSSSSSYMSDNKEPKSHITIFKEVISSLFLHSFDSYWQVKSKDVMIIRIMITSLSWILVIYSNYAFLITMKRKARALVNQLIP